MTYYNAYLAPLGLEGKLKAELKNITHVFGRLFVAKGPLQESLWAQNIWHDARFVDIASIKDAAKTLQAIQRNWWPYHLEHHRRLKLIKDNLPHLAPKPLQFLGMLPTSPLGSFTLVDEKTLFFASSCSSVMPNGEWNFAEDKSGPPSRAYLKLWELFTRMGIHPTKSDVCLDLGASPGGWTFVLAGLAKEVIAFDRSPLEPRIAALSHVVFKAQDAFKVDLKDYPEATWVLSDVVCYPDKLFDYVSNLVAQYPDKKYVFTIKLQGAGHEEVISRFASLPGSLLHLYHNKHELTWFKI